MSNYLEEKAAVNFFILRDPRDQIVSLLNHHKYIREKDVPLETDEPTDDAKLLKLIQGFMRPGALAYSGWIGCSNCCVLRFEKLMGEHGGAATDQDALEELQKVANAIGVKASNARLKKIYQQSFGKGWGFFKGKVGSWKEYFKEEHKIAAKAVVGDLLIELGYETDLNW
jgi:hypothetical protein